MAVIATPGGMNHHHNPSCRALHATALYIISPSDDPVVGPSPMKSKVAAIRIAPPNSRMKVRNRYELMFGAISPKTIRMPRTPLMRARLTNSRDLRENVWARMARAAHGHEVKPMN